MSHICDNCPLRVNFTEYMETTYSTTGKDHESVASIVSSAIGMSDNVAPDE